MRSSAGSSLWEVYLETVNTLLHSDNQLSTTIDQIKKDNSQALQKAKERKESILSEDKDARKTIELVLKGTASNIEAAALKPASLDVVSTSPVSQVAEGSRRLRSALEESNRIFQQWQTERRRLENEARDQALLDADSRRKAEQEAEFRRKAEQTRQANIAELRARREQMILQYDKSVKTKIIINCSALAVVTGITYLMFSSVFN